MQDDEKEQVMGTKLYDKDGDQLILRRYTGGGLILTASKNSGEVSATAIGPLDPEELIGAIRTEAGLAESDCPGPALQAAAEQINGGELRVEGEDCEGKADAELDVEPEPEQSPHEALSEHWSRRMDVVREALTMIPAPGKRGGVAAAFVGEESHEPKRVEKALKIARFAADEDRDIPGVDR